MRKTLKWIACLACVTLTVGLAFGCGGDPEDTSGGTLTIWSCFTDATAGDQHAWDIAEDMFHERYPDISIRVTDHKLNTDCYNDMAYYNAINRLPDIVNTEMYTQAMVEMGYLIDLDEYVTDEYKDTFKAGLLNGVTFDGSLYAIPVRASTMGLLCNVTLLRKCAEYDHLELGGKYTSDWFEGDDYQNGAFLYPATPEKLYEMCVEYKNVYDETNEWSVREEQAGNAYYGYETEGAAMMINVAESGESSAFRALAYMAMFGGSFVDENGEVLLSAAANIEGMEYWQRLVSEGLTYGYGATTEDGVNSYFFAESTATPFMIDISAIFANYLQSATITFDYQYFPLPMSEGVRTTVLCGSVYMGITRSCANPEAAMYFLECLTSAQYQSDMYLNSTNRLPVIQSVIDEALADESGTYAEKNEEMGALLEAFDQNDDIIFGLPGFTTSYSNIWARWINCMNTIYNGGSVSGALATFESDITQYL